MKGGLNQDKPLNFWAAGSKYLTTYLEMQKQNQSHFKTTLTGPPVE